MKELSIEEKAKRYDEAIEIARQIHDADRVSGIELTTCEEIFPELCESEDERIRKEIIEVIESLSLEKEYEYIAWLENQGKITKEWSEMKINNIQTELQEMVDLKQKIEQGEQKLDDMVEPKFHKGDWIAHDIDADYVYHVESVDGCYHLRKGGALVLMPFIEEKYYHLWTIQDAKEGDVLICKGNIKNSNGIKYERICLFNNLDNAFFTLTKTSNFVEEYNIDVNIDYPDNTVPATKEQKEILFMAMTNAGYRWNKEELKLEKIT